MLVVVYRDGYRGETTVRARMGRFYIGYPNGVKTTNRRRCRLVASFVYVCTALIGQCRRGRLTFGRETERSEPVRIFGIVGLRGFFVVAGRHVQKRSGSSVVRRRVGFSGRRFPFERRHPTV